jgi:hypothetical protein
MYGLIRRDVLKRTSLVAPYISSDQILLLQLALLGEFYELSEQLFFFREHPTRSVWRFNTLAGMSGWYDPNRGGRIHCPRLRLVFEFLRSVAGAGIPWREARDCYISILKDCYWHRSSLVLDLVMAMRQFAVMMCGLPPIPDWKSGLAVKSAAGFADDVSDPPSTALSAGKRDGKA